MGRGSPPASEVGTFSECSCNRGVLFGQLHGSAGSAASAGDSLLTASPCPKQPLILQVSGGIILTEGCVLLWAATVFAHLLAVTRSYLCIYLFLLPSCEQLQAWLRCLLGTPDKQGEPAEEAETRGEERKHRFSPQQAQPEFQVRLRCSLVAGFCGDARWLGAWQRLRGD